MSNKARRCFPGYAGAESHAVMILDYSSFYYMGIKVVRA